MRIKIPSDIKLVHKTSSQIVSSLRDFNITESELFDIRFSLEEALINAIKHGNKENVSLLVDISLNKSHEKIEITIEDQGEGFNFKNLPDPTKPENLEKDSGRGVYLIQKLMDRVEYFNNGKGIRMIKHLKKDVGKGGSRYAD